MPWTLEAWLTGLSLVGPVSTIVICNLVLVLLALQAESNDVVSDFCRLRESRRCMTCTFGVSSQACQY